MRDAFGGAFMFKVFLVFIMIYICFTAMALNYARAFKVKNAVIDYLESNEITTLDNLTTAMEMRQIEDYFTSEILGKMQYNYSAMNICGEGVSTGQILANGVYCHPSGVIIELAGEGENTEGVYYTVSTYIGWKVPFLQGLLSLNGNNPTQSTPIGIWKISGQTRLIVNE